MASKKYHIEKIKWKDHSTYTYSAWREMDELKDLSPCTIITTGYVVKEKEEYLVVVPTLDTKSMHGKHAMCILKGAIIKRERV